GRGGGGAAGGGGGPAGGGGARPADARDGRMGVGPAAEGARGREASTAGGGDRRGRTGSPPSVGRGGHRPAPGQAGPAGSPGRRTGAVRAGRGELSVATSEVPDDDARAGRATEPCQGRAGGVWYPAGRRCPRQSEGPNGRPSSSDTTGRSRNWTRRPPPRRTTWIPRPTRTR